MSESRADRTGDDAVRSTGNHGTLRRARERIDALSTPEGPFVVACKDTGRRPVPVAGVRFESYDRAERAAVAAASYREALRRQDPALREHSLVATEADDSSVEFARVRESTGERRANGLPKASQTVTVAGNGSDEWLRVRNGPVVHLAGPDELLDDEIVSRQLDTAFER
jgi:hypothetical protein